MNRLLALAFLLAAGACAGVSVPPDHRLMFAADFDPGFDLRAFQRSDPEAWRLSKVGGGALELAGPSDYQPPVRSPRSIALIAGRKFGDFVLEADLLSTGREDDHRDLCVFFGFRDPAHFYYVHLASQADAQAHNIFLVDGKARQAIATSTTGGVDWGESRWHHLRLERRVNSGRITVFFDDMRAPIMVANDHRFRAGQIGFGSFDDTGRFTRIRVWAPAVILRGRNPFAGRLP